MFLTHQSHFLNKQKRIKYPFSGTIFGYIPTPASGFRAHPREALRPTDGIEAELDRALQQRCELDLLVATHAWIGRATGRVSLEQKILSGILQEHFFVCGIWVETLKLQKEKPRINNQSADHFEVRVV